MNQITLRLCTEIMGKVSLFSLYSHFRKVKVLHLIFSWDPFPWESGSTCVEQLGESYGAAGDWKIWRPLGWLRTKAEVTAPCSCLLHKAASKCVPMSKRKPCTKAYIFKLAEILWALLEIRLMMWFRVRGTMGERWEQWDPYFNRTALLSAVFCLDFDMMESF